MLHVLVDRATLSLSAVAACVIGPVWYCLAPRSRASVVANLSRALPEADQAGLSRLARRVFVTVARNYGDLVCATWLSQAGLACLFALDGRERIDAAIAGGRGVIVVAPHVGNVSLAAMFAAANGYPSVVVVEQLRSAVIHRLVASLRSRWGVRIVAADAAGLRTVLDALRRGELAVLLVDRTVTGVGVSVPFFGHMTRLPSGPAVLARRTGAAIVPVSTMRMGLQRSVIRVWPPVVAGQTASRQDDVLATTTAVTRMLEQAIRSAPGEWAVLQAVWDEC